MEFRFDFKCGTQKVESAHKVLLQQYGSIFVENDRLTTWVCECMLRVSINDRTTILCW